jgi:drug/metabolite transporter (DMT)-like permease
VLVLVQVLFGTLPLAGQIAMRGIPPLGLATLRIAGAAIALSLLAGRRLRTIERRDLPFVALLAALGIVGNQILFLEGLARTTQANASVLMVTIPVMTVGFALLFREERTSGTKLAGVSLGLLGAAILLRVERFDVRGSHVLGNLLLTINASFFALYMVLARRILRRVEARVVVAWMFLLAAAAVLPFGLPAVIAAVDVAAPASWWAAGWAVLGPTVATYLLNAWTLGRVESSRVASYTYLQPVVAVTLAWWFAGEPLTVRTGLAAAAIFAGVALVQRRGKGAKDGKGAG